jgi:hypothetical protein
MSNIKITKQFSFETGMQWLTENVKNVHGHSKLSVTFLATPILIVPNVRWDGIDFTDLKNCKEEVCRSI